MSPAADPQRPNGAAEHEEVDELASNYDGDESEDEEDDDNGFRIRDMVAAPSACALTTDDLHGQVHQAEIDLDPPYQRDVVWREAKQIALIDSLFKNMYVPPLLFAVKVNEDGLTTRVCVDGKQRLTAIVRFIDGLIPYQDPKTKKKFWFTRSVSQSRAKLLVPERYRRLFLDKTLTCVDYSNIPGETERELFQRVQNGVALTPAEKLQALSSPWVEWINALQRKYVTEADGFNAYMDWNVTRGRDFDCLARTIYIVYHLPESKMPGQEKLHKWLRECTPPEMSFKQLVYDVYDSFVLMTSTEGLNEAFAKIEKRVAPVEFIFIGVLLAKTRNLSIEDRAKQVYALRRHLRNKHKDVRLNNVVWKSAWDFLDGVPTKGSWAINGGARQPRRGRKRKRDDEDDSEDGDYRG